MGTFLILREQRAALAENQECPHFPSERGRTRSNRRLGTLAAFLLEFLADALALELGQVIDEELALEVIDFVLDADPQQPYGLEFLPGTAQVLVLDPDPPRPLDVLENAGDRQAPLLADRLIHKV